MIFYSRALCECNVVFGCVCSNYKPFHFLETFHAHSVINVSLERRT